MSETTAMHEPEFSVLIEPLQKSEFNEATKHDVLHSNGAYCAHCNEIHLDLRFKKLLGNIYVADCPNGHNFILLELVEDERNDLDA